MNKKDWTVFIYAGGNNELEPEMWRIEQDLERIAIKENINVLMQIARGERELVRILRPSVYLPRHLADAWTGIRRYLFGNRRANLLQSLGKGNMADPKILRNFLLWGIQNFPSHHYALILSGHGYQFVGALTDYSGKRPYIMGLPEMALCLNTVAVQTGAAMDILVADVCFFNLFEVLYEFGCKPNPVVKQLITYIKEGPVFGLPLDKLVTALQENPKSESADIVKRIVDTLECDLVGFDIDYSKMEGIKQTFHDLGTMCLARRECVQGLERLCVNDPLRQKMSELVARLASLVQCYKRLNTHDEGLIGFASLPTDQEDKIKLYSRLAFGRNNAWVQMLDKRGAIGKDTQPVIRLQPRVMLLREVYGMISNMNLGLEEAVKQKILTSLLNYTKWPKSREGIDY